MTLNNIKMLIYSLLKIKINLQFLKDTQNLMDHFFYILKEIKDLCKIVLLRRRINKFYSSEIITNMSVFFKMDREQISKEDLDKFYLDLKLNGYNIHTKDEEFLRFIRKNNPLPR
jgi:hypothetical protein